MTIETATITTFTRSHSTGTTIIHKEQITGNTFTSEIGNLKRKFIIHKTVTTNGKNYVLTDIKTGLRVGDLEATTKKTATSEAAHDLLFKLVQKHGLDRFIQTFHNADLQAGLEPQI